MDLSLGVPACWTSAFPPGTNRLTLVQSCDAAFAVAFELATEDVQKLSICTLSAFREQVCNKSGSWRKPSTGCSFCFVQHSASGKQKLETSVGDQVRLSVCVGVSGVHTDPSPSSRLRQ